MNIGGLNNYSILQKIHLYSVMLLAFVIPVKIKFAPVFIILSILSLIIQRGFWKNFKDKYSNKYFLISLSVYFICIIASIYSESKNMEITIFDLQVKLSFLLLPFLFFGNDIIRKDKQKVIKFFIYGVLLACLICFGYATYRSFNYIDGIWCFNTSYWTGYKDKSFVQLFLLGASFFSGNFFSEIVHHHSYLGLYLLTAIIFLIDFLKKRFFKTRVGKLLQIFFIILFILFLVMLQSRANYIALIALALMYGGWYVCKSKKLFIKLIIPVVIILLVVFMGKYTRFSSSFNTDIVTNFEKAKKENIRLALWDASIKVVKRNPIFGVGTGDIKTELRKEYQKMDLEQALDSDFNPHNQFLETIVGQGLVGLLVLLLWFIIPLVQAIKKRDLIMIAFLIVLAVNLFFESMFNRVAGVVFIAFFYNFLVSFYVEEKNKLN